MIDHQLATHQTIRKSIRLNAPLNAVREALTQPGLMKSWMADSEIEIITDCCYVKENNIEHRISNIEF